MSNDERQITIIEWGKLSMNLNSFINELDNTIGQMEIDVSMLRSILKKAVLIEDGLENIKKDGE